MDFTTALDHHLAAIDARDLEAYMATVHDQATIVLPGGGHSRAPTPSAPSTGSGSTTPTGR